MEADSRSKRLEARHFGERIVGAPASRASQSPIASRTTSLPSVSAGSDRSSFSTGPATGSARAVRTVIRTARERDHPEEKT